MSTAPPPPPWDPSAPHPVRCPHCNLVGQAPGNLRHVACPQCGEQFDTRPGQPPQFSAVAPPKARARRWWRVVAPLAAVAAALALFLPASPLSLIGRPTKTLKVHFAVVSTDDWENPLDDGDPCDGSDVSAGYGDINSITAVKVTTINDDVIARTTLGLGTVDGDACRFEANVELEEGSDDGKGFVVGVGNRGTTQIDWDEIENPFAGYLTLGD